MKIRRTTAVVGAGALVATLAFPASAAHLRDRIEGGTRDETAVELSKVTNFGEPEGSDPADESEASAIVTRRDLFPDALAASYLSSQLGGAPILLTETDSLTEVTADELERLNIERVYVLGLEEAVSASVEDQLDDDYEVTRIGGGTRFDTAQQIAEFDGSAIEGVENPGVGTLGNSGRTAFIATGEKFPDALAAGPLSWHESFPVILTAGGALSEQAENALDNLDIEYAVVLGGPDAIQQGVQDEIEDLGVDTQRIEGGTRRDTAVNLANFARTELGFTQDTVVLTQGENFPDALASGPYGGLYEAPIVLTESVDLLGDATTNFLSAQAGAIENVVTLGGTDAVSEGAASAARDIAE